MSDTIKTKKPRYKKTNVKVVDAKTGEKKDDGSTGKMNAENFINYINMKYPNYNISQTPNAKRNRRQSAKALEIINSRKKPSGIIKKDVGGKVIPSRKGKVTSTEKARIARNKAIVPAMKAKKKSLSKIRKKGDTKKLLQRIERGTRQGKPSAHSLANLQEFSLLPFMKFMSRRGNKENLINGKNSFERQVDPKLKGSIKGNKYLSSFANKLGMTTSKFEEEYLKHFKKYEGTKITPKDTESIMKKIKTISKKYNSPVPKKIKPAKQKAINQAAPVIEKIVNNNKSKPKVKFTPKPERPLSSKAKQRQIIKQSKKAGGGKVRNRNMGGVIGGGLGSQDVVDYLYKYKS